jgi:hypothetical protein
MDNNKPFDLGKRDIDLEKISKQIAAKEQLLRSKQYELSKKGKDNEYLEDVYNEYKNISTKIQKEKEELIVAMKKITQHLDDIIKTIESKEEIQHEKKIIVKTINRLTKELEELRKENK